MSDEIRVWHEDERGWCAEVTQTDAPEKDADRALEAIWRHETPEQPLDYDTVHVELRSVTDGKAVYSELSFRELASRAGDQPNAWTDSSGRWRATVPKTDNPEADAELALATIRKAIRESLERVQGVYLEGEVWDGQSLYFENP